jgi:TusA-related sulfurtransferase
MGFFSSLFKKNKPTKPDASAPVGPVLDDTMFDVYLDCLDMICPRPTFEVSQKMKELKPGNIIKVSCKDHTFENNIIAWCKRTGNTIIKNLKHGEIVTVLILKR